MENIEKCTDLLLYFDFYDYVNIDIKYQVFWIKHMEIVY